MQLHFHIVTVCFNSVICHCALTQVIAKRCGLLLLLIFTGMLIVAAWLRVWSRQTEPAFVLDRKGISNLKSDHTTSKALWENALKSHFVMPNNTAWGGHAVVLFSALYATQGAILELGSGWFSTSTIHNVAVVEQSRDAYTVDSDVHWLAKFTAMGNSHHTFAYVSNVSQPGAFTDTPYKPQRLDSWDRVWRRQYGLVFVDHAPGERRHVDIQIFRNLTDVMLIHDTDNPTGYKFEPLLSTFRYRYKFRRRPSINSYTDVVSDTREDLVEKIELLTDWTCELLHL